MRVNLLPYQLVQKAGRNWQAIFALGGIVLLAGVTLIFYVALQAQVASYQHQIDEMEEEYKQYTAAMERKDLLDEMQAAFTEKSNFIAQLSGLGVKWNLIMDELRDIVPRTVVLDTVASDAKANINISGRAGSLQALSQFMVNIQKGSHVSSPNILTVNWDQDLAAFVFTMTCQPKGASSGG